MRKVQTRATVHEARMGEARKMGRTGESCPKDLGSRVAKAESPRVLVVG